MCGVRLVNAVVPVSGSPRDLGGKLLHTGPRAQTSGSSIRRNGRTSKGMYIYIYIYIYVHVYTCIHVYIIFIYIYICIYTYTYTYTCIHVSTSARALDDLEVQVVLVGIMTNDR